LRIRHDIDENDSIYQTFFGAGTWIAPPAFTSTQYEWWTTGMKECLVRATVGGFGQNPGAPTIEYQDIYLGLDAGLTTNDFTIDFYPNPASEWCFFNSSSPVEKLSIFNISGERVLEHPTAALQGYFDISNLAAGTYTIWVQTAKSTSYKKLIKL